MGYKTLLAWQHAMDLCDEVYRVTEAFPKREIFGLTAQLRDSAVSVPSNIAEGEGRFTRGERRQFLGHSRGSLYEVDTQLLIARRHGYAVPAATFKLLETLKTRSMATSATCCGAESK